ncbi:MAG TPA: helix-turn-helix domain-containing protein [Sediminispirochaeta sp.]|nr:helix-turn-helix domain-containing protein [Sediminispirochaeta sp.]
MTNDNQLKPYINISAGDMIRRELDFLGWTQEDLAQVTDISRKTLSSIMNAKQKLLMEHAVKLSEALGGSPESWMNIDARYWISLNERKKELTQTERKARIRRYVPVLEIHRKGWYTGGKSADDYEATYRKIWGDDDPDINFQVYEAYRKNERYCARRSKSDDQFTDNYSITWYRIAKKRSEQIAVPPYSRDKLTTIADNLLEYTAGEKGILEVIRDLNAAGVKFLVQSHLSKTYLDGASFFADGHPVIVYTARYNRVDNFWFTLAHELAHLLLHFKGSTEGFFLDDLKDRSEISKIEREADEKAEEILHVARILKLAEPYRSYLTEGKLKSIAAEIGIDLSLLLGILQYHGFVDYRKLNRYKKPVVDLLPKEG